MTKPEQTALQRLKQRAARLKLDVYALYLAARDVDTPWYVRVLVVAIVAYALSPIDLIPDFIPVLGLLDDLLLLPLAITLAVRLIPDRVMNRCRAQASEQFSNAKPVSRAGAIVVILIWLLAFALVAGWLARVFYSAQ